MSLKPYPNYKPSGVAWLGDVPEHWDVKRLKRMATIHNGRDYKHVELDEGGFPVIGSGGEFTRSSEYLYSGESVLLGRKGTINKPLYINGEFWTVDTMFYTQTYESTLTKYLYYCSLTIRFDLYSTSTALPSMTQADLASIQFGVPKIEEQTTIANFLDFETRKIDALIAEQQQLIVLLAEKRQATISHAVTKGLNPKAPMKDSGVVWLGEVPEHWATMKVARAFPSIGSGTTPKSDNALYYDDENGTPWLNTGDLNDGDLYSCSKKVSDLAIKEHSTLKIYPPNSVVIAMYGATIGKLAILKFSTTVNQACCVFGVSEVITKDFIFYWLFGLRAQIISLATGGGQPNISQDVIKNLFMAAPCTNEQTAIANYLDVEISKLDTLQTEANNVIALLKERRTALISAAVTGKIDVRGWTAPQNN